VRRRELIDTADDYNICFRHQLIACRPVVRDDQFDTERVEDRGLFFVAPLVDPCDRVEEKDAWRPGVSVWRGHREPHCRRSGMAKWV
jgi:hypothetical protein